MEINLKSGHMASGRGKGIILCRKGKVWITWPGGMDVILKENERVEIPYRGKILIENMEPGTSCIAVPGKQMYREGK